MERTSKHSLFQVEVDAASVRDEKRVVALILTALMILLPLTSVSAEDLDLDSIDSNSDECPLAFGNSTIDRIGCPDRDGDGTSDLNDPWVMSNGGFLQETYQPSNNDHYISLFSKDGNYYMTSDGTNLRIWSSTTKANLISIAPGNIHDIAWSPDGEFAAMVDDSDLLYVYNVSNNLSKEYEVSVDVGGGDQALEVEYNPNGTMIAVVIGRSGNGGTNGEVQIYNSSTGNEITSFNPSGADRFYSVEWSPDGSRIVIGGREDIWVYNTATWVQNATRNTNRGSINAVDWSPDGKSIAVCEAWESSGARIRMIDYPSMSQRWVYDTSTSCQDIVFSPDSTQVAGSHTYYQSDGASIRIFNTYGSSPSIIDTLSAPRPGGCTSGGGGNDCGTIYGLDWHPDGYYIISAHGRNDDGIYHWKVDPDKDGDGYLNPVDAFPEDATQWNDTDLDGYGDNLNGTEGDVCPDVHGLSNKDRHGCPDADGDGWSDLGDDFPADQKQWVDVDQDGVGDNYECMWDSTTQLCISQEGDKFPNDVTQWFDTDGDGYGDNYGNASWTANRAAQPTLTTGWPGAFVVGAGNADALPVHNDQWNDTDGDLWGDNPNTIPEPRERADSCPHEWGDSWRIEYGCPDSDRDGSGIPFDSHPDDPTQWEDLDQDGYGDNKSGTDPDDCPQWPGNSSMDRLGCPDADGDGYSDPSKDGIDDTKNWSVSDGADAITDNPTQWIDDDEDGCGDNQTGTEADLFLNNPDQCFDRDGDGYGDNRGAADGMGDDFPDDKYQWSDKDGDGKADNWDPETFDPSLRICHDFDQDGSPDPCPGEAIENANMYVDTDFCPNRASATESGCPDSDGDGIDDNLEPWEAWINDYDRWRDRDGDGWADNPGALSNQTDHCPDHKGTSTEDRQGCPDFDGDGWSDESTGEGAQPPLWTVRDGADMFSTNPTQWSDCDSDGYGDNWADPKLNASREGKKCDIEMLNGIINQANKRVLGIWFDEARLPDLFPLEATQWQDTDGDGYGDNFADPSWASSRESEWPGIMIENASKPDRFPTEITQWGDRDGDGFGNNESLAAAFYDRCPLEPGTATNLLSQGCPDRDGDGTADRDDVCPDDPKHQQGLVTCASAEQNLESNSGGLLSSPAVLGIGGIAILGIIVAVILLALRPTRNSGDEELVQAMANSEEEARRQQWIDHYVSNGHYDEARKLGWTGIERVGPSWQDLAGEHADFQQASVPEMIDLSGEQNP